MLPFAVAGPRYSASYEVCSYANVGGMGDRRNLIIVEPSTGLGGNIVAAKLLMIDGSHDEGTDTIYIEPAGSVEGLHIDFIFPEKVIMDKVKIYQGLTPSATHGNWQMRIDPENDGNLSDIGPQFEMGGAAIKEYECPATGTPFKKLRVAGISGTANNGGYSYWMEFEFSIGNLL
jgi:hypothetical protein